MMTAKGFDVGDSFIATDYNACACASKAGNFKPAVLAREINVSNRIVDLFAAVL